DALDAPAARGAPRLRDAQWVRPRLVAQVRFTEWTADGKLRHPAFQGIRADKQPEECGREKPASSLTPRPADPKRAVAKKLPAASRGRRLELSNPGRLLFPNDKITKQDVADYYAAVAEPFL